VSLSLCEHYCLVIFAYAYDWPLLKTLYAPSTAASATAKGSHSCFTIAVPTMSKPAGIYTPLMYCGENALDIFVIAVPKQLGRGPNNFLRFTEGMKDLKWDTCTPPHSVQ
jgi:hypothetical protein